MKRLLLAISIAALIPSSAPAQSNKPPISYPNATGNFSSPGTVASFLNADGNAVPLSTTNPLPIAITPITALSTPRSGSIQVGGAWQQVSPSNPGRHRFVLQNPCSSTMQGISAAEDLLLAIGNTQPTTTNGSWEVAPCGSYDSGTAVVGTGAVWARASTTGHLFTAVEW
jgi:hypothetical protein